MNENTDDDDITVVSQPLAGIEHQGSLIGPYKLLQQIGEGGFGTVWMAEQQQPIRRRVALKIIKAGMDTREVVGRFEQERQALAMMDHPNIAQVYDAGCTESGRPFFVMELVKGVPITQFCDEQKLGTRERLLLFADVCSAINHAHQKGIIHRDIKPSNVMVTLHGMKAVPKVIDFGIAKATQNRLTDKTLFTRFEQFIGTPVYMSPEQAALSGLDIDTRSDIYALGILLYELLTGRPPFDAQSLVSAGYDEMRRIIREVEPPRPSSRLSTVAGDERTTIAAARHVQPDKLRHLVEPDLDWIVMKAIDKDRSRRYETANAFALDIQHFLADETVSATPPGAGHRLRKFARRHKVALRVATAISLLLVTGTIVSSLLAFRAIRAEQALADQLREVARERDEKEVARADAEGYLKMFNDMLRSPDPSHNSAGITVAESLDRAAAVVDASLASHPARRAKMQAALGSAYAALGQVAKAIPLQERVRDYYGEHPGPDRRDYIAALADLGWSYDFANRRAEAVALQREVLKWWQERSPPNPQQISKAMGDLGRTLWFFGQKEEALSLQEKALQMGRINPGLQSPQTLEQMHFLAVAYNDSQRGGEARKLDDELLPLCIQTLGTRHPVTIRAMSAAAAHVDDPRGRSLSQEKVIELAREVNGPEHPFTLASLAKQAGYLPEAGETDQALKLLENLLPRMLAAQGEKHMDTLWVKSSLATAYDLNGQKAKALEMRAEISRLSEDFLGPEHYDTLGAKARLALSYAEAQRFDEALWLRSQILPILVRVRGAQHGDTLWVRNDLLHDYERAGKTAEVVDLRKEMLAQWLESHGEDDLKCLAARQDLALAYSANAQHDEAVKLQEETLRIARGLKSTPNSILPQAMKTMLDCYQAAGRKEEAARLMEQMNAKSGSETETVLVPASAAWRWLHPQDGKDPADTVPDFHRKFFLPDFDDTSWKQNAGGMGGFGYSDAFKVGVDIGKPVEGSHRHTAYFRHAFTTDAEASHLVLRCWRDDGIVVYLDGREVLRDNVEPGPEGYLLPAMQTMSGHNDGLELQFPIAGSLAPGPHLLAISLHNTANASSDLLLGGIKLVAVVKP